MQKLEFMKIRPIYHFSSEIYSNGKCFRGMARYPRFLPLFFASDHGVHLGSKRYVGKNRSTPNPLFYLSWNSGISQKQRVSLPRVINIQHPWIHYRKKNSIEPKVNAIGTLYFPHHNVPGQVTEGFKDEAVVEYLLNLPKEKLPIKVCLHFHDFKTQRGDIFESAGFEVVSAGDSNENEFIDKFYEILMGAKFTISENWGSQIAYAIEAGIPSQLIHHDLRVQDSKESSIFEHDDDSIFWDRYSEARRLFSSSEPVISEEQRNFIFRLVGIDHKRSCLKTAFYAWVSAILLAVPWIALDLIPELARITVGRIRLKILEAIRR